MTDGKLDDAAWKDATVLGPFVAYVEAPEYRLSARTRARATYDDEHLYVSFRCDEPDMETTREGCSDSFDDVTVILAPQEDREAWRGFRVGADTKHRDLHPGGDEAGWAPDYESAVELGDKMWSVEMAIPWKALGRGVPARGEELAANVAHMRVRPRDEQYSTWSKFRGKADGRPAHILVEPVNLGTWTFQ